MKYTFTVCYNKNDTSTNETIVLNRRDLNEAINELLYRTNGDFGALYIRKIDKIEKATA